MTSLPESPRQTPAPPRLARRLPILRRLQVVSPNAIIAFSVALVLLIGLLDYAIGNEISVTAFYLLPIVLLAWCAQRPWGMVGAVLSTVVWLVANLAAGLHYSQPAIYVWNSLMQLGINVVVAYLLTQLRLVLRDEQQLARTDFVTGALNSRAFFEALALEIARASRHDHPLTIAYIDLDNFKAINDELGHAAGDDVLRAVASAARGSLRANDTVARTGGDEFVLLLPETGLAEARPALDKVRQCLLAAMAAQRWPITFSIGALVFRGSGAGRRPLPLPDDLLRAADNLLYAVKRAGKNGLQFGEYPAPA